MEEQLKELQKEIKHLRMLISDMEFIIKRTSTDMRLITRDIEEIKNELYKFN